MVRLVDKLLLLTSTTREKIDCMSFQTKMMSILLNDLMNQAQLANNTFSMVNKKFDCISLIKRCMVSFQVQAKQKNVNLVGPILKSPIDKYYFRNLFSDERRYSQIILNFLSNSVKFTKNDGTVTVFFNIISITDLEPSLSFNEKHPISIDSQNSMPYRTALGVSNSQDESNIVHKMLSF